jgi:hypothetical protein
MRFTVSPEQQKFFNLQHYLEVEDLLSVEESKALLGAIKTLRTKSPGYPDEFLFRSIPLIASLAKKKGWGQMVATLLHKKPVRIEFDQFSDSLPSVNEPMDEGSCGLLIDLKSRRGFFFKDLLLAKHLYKSPRSCYLFLVLTTNYLPEHIHPIIAV